MKSACIAIAAACLAPCALACSSGDSGAPSGCDGGDAARTGDARNADVVSDARGADAASEGATADVGTDVLAADAREAQASTEGGADASIDAEAGADAAQRAESSVIDATLSTTALLRLANWSPDAPAVDFCLALHGTTAFRGPLVAGLGAQQDAASAALSFPLVGSYFDLPPGQYDARVVAGGAGNCAVGITPDVTTLGALTARTFSTIALIGEELPSGGDPGLQVVSFSDDGVSTGLVQLRFIHAAPGVPQADMGMGVMPQFTPVFVGVPFGQASTAGNDPKVPQASLPVVDANGYQRILKVADATLSAHPSGASMDTVMTNGLSAAWGSVLTIALVGGTSAGVPARLLECVDNAGTVGPFSTCTLLP